jgi:hypothetical protein
MTRLLGSVVVGLLTVGVASAHFPFILPDPSGTSAKVVFSDDLTPDPKVDLAQLATAKFTLRDGSGKESPLELKKGEGFYDVAVPGFGPRVVYGVADSGVKQKGDDKPFRLVYYPKAVIGAADAKAVGGPLRAEIVSAAEPGKVRFQVLGDGKPVAEAEGAVIVPGVGKKTFKADKEGFTPTFAEPGRYGVYARWTEAKPGELAGAKFTETRHYATLVIDVGK